MVTRQTGVVLVGFMTEDDGYKIDKTINSEWLNDITTQSIFSAFNREGFQARVVGGAIRNTLLGQKVKDIDFATTASPEQAINLAHEADLKVIPTGLKHGTITIVVGGAPFEVTTLREDVETDGRHAQVSFTKNWKTDASRRDFTINALYADEAGRLYDPVGGYEDVVAGRLRFIGEPVERIREDYLRILRYFRFQAEYNLKSVDNASLKACVAETKGLAGLSAERVISEVEKILTGPHAVHVINLMYDYAVLLEVLGLVAHPLTLEKLITLEKRFSDVPDVVLRLGALCCLKEEDGLYLSQRFKLSNQKKALICSLNRPDPTFVSDMSLAEAKVALYKLGPKVYQNKVLYCWVKAQADICDEAWTKLFELVDQWDVPEFPIRGQDLINLGMEKGPEIGVVLKALEVYWIQHDFKPGKSSLLDYVTSLMKTV